MNLWLRHFGYVFVASGIILFAVPSLAGWSVPGWVVVVWVLGSLLASVPLHWTIERAQNRALVSELETRHPGVAASSVNVAFAEWVGLLRLAPQLKSRELSERYDFVGRGARSREYLAVLIADGQLEFWTGPSRSPQLVLQVPWSNVAVDRDAGRVVVYQDATAVAATFIFTDDSPRTQRSRDEMGRRLRLVGERAMHE